MKYFTLGKVWELMILFKNIHFTFWAQKSHFSKNQNMTICIFYIIMFLDYNCYIQYGSIFLNVVMECSCLASFKLPTISQTILSLFNFRISEIELSFFPPELKISKKIEDGTHRRNNSNLLCSFKCGFP